MGFPIRLAANTYTKDDFEGVAYYAGIPSLATDVVAHTGSVSIIAATGQNNIFVGKKFFNAMPYAPIFVGMRVSMRGTNGGTPVLYGRVLEYDETTGYLVVNCLSSRATHAGNSGFILQTGWTIKINGMQQEPATGPLSVAQNGTNARDLMTARLNLSQPCPSKAYTLLEDFIGSYFESSQVLNNLAWPWGMFGSINSKASTVISQDHQGVLQMNATAGVPITSLWYWSGSQSTGYGVLTPSTSLATFIGGGTRSWFLEWQIQLPTLSNVTNRYNIRVGIAATLNNGVATTTSALAWFAYTDTANSGSWQVQTTGNSTVLTTANPVSAVVAATWYKLRMTYTSGGGLVFSVNGVNIATVAPGTTLPAAFSCVPYANITRTVGAGGVMDVDYMQYFGT